MKWQLENQLQLYLVMGGSPNQWGVPAFEIAQAALEGGVSVLQWRDKTLPISAALPIAREIRNLCRKKEVPFLVNDRVDLAMLLDADGVHLGQDDLPLVEARQLLGSQRIIGISCGTFAEAETAQRGGADYIGVGAIYRTATKSDAGEPIGTALITQIDRELSIPQVGIGGIQAHNSTAVIEAGAEGVAVVSAITEASEIARAASELLRAVQGRG